MKQFSSFSLVLEEEEKKKRTKEEKREGKKEARKEEKPKRKETKRKEILKTRENVLSKYFAIDCKGDPSIKEFQCLYKRDIPLYKRIPSTVIGLPLNIRMISTHDGVKFVEREVFAQKRQKLQAEENAIPCQKIQQMERNQDSDNEFISLGMDWEEIESAVMISDDFREKQQKLNERLRLNPRDLNGWRELLQQQGNIPTRQKCERQVAICERALDNGNVEIIPEYISILSQISDVASVLNAWNKLLKQFDEPQVWKGFIGHHLHSFGFFTYNQSISAFEDAFRQEKYFLFPMLFELMLLSGYTERAIGLLQAIVEFNLNCPIGCDEKEFEYFWNSESLLIGEIGSGGWDGSRKKVIEMIEYTKLTLTLLPTDTSFKKWLALERQRDSLLFFPRKYGTIEEDDDDPDRVVMFEDILPFIFKSSHINELILECIFILVNKRYQNRNEMFNLFNECHSHIISFLYIFLLQMSTDDFFYPLYFALESFLSFEKAEDAIKLKIQSNSECLEYWILYVNLLHFHKKQRRAKTILVKAIQAFGPKEELVLEMLNISLVDGSFDLSFLKGPTLLSLLKTNNLELSIILHFATGRDFLNLEFHTSTFKCLETALKLNKIARKTAVEFISSNYFPCEEYFRLCRDLSSLWTKDDLSNEQEWLWSIKYSNKKDYLFEKALTKCPRSRTLWIEWIKHSRKESVWINAINARPFDKEIYMMGIEYELADEAIFQYIEEKEIRSRTFYEEIKFL